ncbi:Amidohydrolase 2 [Frankia canadensis]|uniref:Amidohydrolase 2 n=1 Tax=Frankia canadensis TaxID=1836972 RepID=A0A2I2KLJ4_9ACTN|nr:amidohydrolase family protein [Frankia canadensis]SNQ46540.1 Amidohydrolase 2 [Frankia canadensis]SOU53830.1 Amidohydrolase 2 [Frankia canadensis]
MTYDGPLFDCDNHNYEVRDAFTRHLDPAFARQAIQPVRLPDGREVILAGDRVVRCLEPEFNEVYRPGTLKEMLRQMASGNPDETYTFEPMREEYQDREARLARMREQNVQGAVMFSGGWSLFAEEYVDDTDGLYANIHSFNRWTEETWGWDGEIVSPALISLRDVDQAGEELDRVLGRGAKLVLFSVGPVDGRSPGDPHFDPVYARLQEAGAAIAFHITEHWYNRSIAPAWGHEPAPIHFRMSAWQWMNTYGTYPITSTLSALIFDNVFGRFPELQCLVAEFGADWVPLTLSKLDKSRGMGRNGPWIGGQLTERPSEVFRKHIKVVPYPEDDVVGLVHQVGHADAFVMGSDYPHAEGLAEPRDFAKLVDSLSDEDQHKILWGNAQTLLRR